MVIIGKLLEHQRMNVYALKSSLLYIEARRRLNGGKFDTLRAQRGARLWL